MTQNDTYQSLKAYQHPELSRLDTLPDSLAVSQYISLINEFEQSQNWRGYTLASAKLCYRYAIKRDSLRTLEIFDNNLGKSEEHLGNRHPDLFNYYLGNGQLMRESEELKIAEDLLLKAEELGAGTYVQNTPEWLELLFNLSYLYAYNLDDYYKADRYSKRMLEFENDYNTFRRAYLYYATATIKGEIGENEASEIYSLKALEEYGKVPGLNLGFAYVALANAYQRNQRYDLAIKYYNYGIEKYIELGGPDYWGLALLYGNLTNDLSNIGKDEEAQSYAREGLRILDLPDNDVPESRFTLEWNMASSLDRQGNHAEAIEFYQKALETGKIASKHDEDLAIVCLEMALTYLALDDVASAYDYFDKGFVYLSGVRFSLEPNAVTSAMIPEWISAPPIIAGLARTSFLLAFESGGQEEADRALQTYLLADTLLTKTREFISTEGAYLQFLDEASAIYQSAIADAFMAYSEHRDSKYISFAHNFFERSRSQVLIEKLAESKSRSILPDSVVAELRDLDIKYVFLKNKLELLNRGNNPDSASQALLAGNLLEVTRNKEELEEVIRRNFPRYYDLDARDSDTSTENIQKLIKKSGGELLEYFYADSDIYIISISGNSADFRRIAIDEELLSHMSVFHNTLAQQNIDPFDQEAFEKFIISANYLYNKLVHSSSELMEKITVIPHGPIAQIPFEALITALPAETEINYKTLDYLIKQVEISYEHSVNTMIEGLQNPASVANPEVVGFAFSEQVNDGDAVRQDVLVELPGTAEEVKALEAQFGSGEFYFGVNATKSKATNNFGKDIIHLAVHGLADTENRYRSSLIFKSEDTYDSLYAYEIFSQDVDASLVVLSACETGVGKIYQGEGVFNLARGFAYAGTPSVIMSLWQITDQSSAKVMSAFYKYLNEGQDVNRSLRSAKLDYLEQADRFTAHPSQWAAFVHFGANTRFKTTNWWLYALGSGLILAAFGIYYSRKKSAKAT